MMSMAILANGSTMTGSGTRAQGYTTGFVTPKPLAGFTTTTKVSHLLVHSRPVKTKSNAIEGLFTAKVSPQRQRVRNFENVLMTLNGKNQLVDATVFALILACPLSVE